MNDDDELLAGLGRAAREEEAQDAARSRMPDAAEAHRPFDAAELDRFAGSITSDTAQARAAAAAPIDLAAARRSRMLAWVGGPLAAAAAIALWLSRPVPPMPEYELGFAGDVQGARANGPADLLPEARVSRGATFEMVVRPTEPATFGVAARAALVRDGHARWWDAPASVSRDGAVRVIGPAASLFPAPNGAYEVVVVVGRAEDVPTDTHLVAIAEKREEAPKGTRVVRGRVTLVE